MPAQAATISCHMREITSDNFGLLIAYLVPGFTVLLGVSYFSETAAAWLRGASAAGPTIGGFLYVTLASVAAGMTCSAVRFHIVDRIHSWTGISHPRWDFTKLAERIAAYDVLIEIHYNYYKFHANSLVALTVLYFARQSAVRGWSLGIEDIAFLLLGVVFFATSRDNLRKYYTRVAKLLGTEGNRTDGFVSDQSAPRTTEVTRRPTSLHKRAVKKALNLLRLTLH